MKVYVLTTEDGGDNEIFAGCVTDLALVNNIDSYNIHMVEVDSPFNAFVAYKVPAQTFL
jgi:hypothetical protein